jgi:hypothetical protein
MTGHRVRTAAPASPHLAVQASAYRKCCAAVTCGEQLRVGRIFCTNHWFFLPLWLRRAIVNTFRDQEWTAHQEAVQQAADFVDNAQMIARDAGFTKLVSAKQFDTKRSRGKLVRYAGKVVA